jgi:hypothetical protein
MRQDERISWRALRAPPADRVEAIVSLGVTEHLPDHRAVAPLEMPSSDPAA